MDKAKFQYEGLRWIREMELLSHPQLINHLKMNVLLSSPRIKETELLISTENKQMLVYLELTWFGKKFFKKTIFADVEDVLAQMLPSFKFRIISDPKIFEMALNKVTQALTRRPESEKPNVTAQPITSLSADSAKPNDAPSNSTVTNARTDLQSDSEKQSKD